MTKDKLELFFIYIAKLEDDSFRDKMSEAVKNKDVELYLKYSKQSAQMTTARHELETIYLENREYQTESKKLKWALHKLQRELALKTSELDEAIKRISHLIDPSKDLFKNN